MKLIEKEALSTIVGGGVSTSPRIVSLRGLGTSPFKRNYTLNDEEIVVSLLGVATSP